MIFRNNKPALLGKAKSNDNSSALDDFNPKSPLRESVQVLSQQQLVKRGLLNQKWSGHSSEATSNAAMTNSNGLGRSVSSSDAGMKSSNTVNSLVSNIESKIDVGQAISLLQELKKSASPEELVALHRALLPVKEDKPPSPPSPSCPQLPPIEEIAYTSAPPSRTKSAMLPGLATRSSGLFDDLLRKPSDPATVKPPPKETWRIEWPNRISGGGSSPTRLGTPNDHSWHAGAYQTGTLRITNGTASPEPSLITKLADSQSQTPEAAKAKLADTQTPQPPKGSNYLDIASKSVSTIATTILDDDRRDSASEKQLFSPDENDEDEEDPQTPCPSKARPDSDTLTLKPRSTTKEQLMLDKPLQRQSFQGAQPSATSENIPRFQQRWDHRASHLSQEYIVDCGLTESPQEEKNGLFDFGTRLSTVMDDDTEDDENLAANNHRTVAHARTLSKLTGEFPDVGPSEIGAARTSDEQQPAPGPEMQIATRAHVVRKMDSGYCSDDLRISGNQPDSSATAQDPQTTVAPDEVATFSGEHNNLSPEDQRRSLYTLEQMVQTSPSSESGSAPSPNNSVKKPSPLSLFKSKSRRKSFKVINVEHGSNRGDAAARTQSVESSTDTDTKRNTLRKKKLQKPMPPEIRHQRKKTKSDLRAAAESQETLTPSKSSTSAPGSALPSDAEGDRSRPSTSTIRPAASSAQLGDTAPASENDTTGAESFAQSESPSVGWLRKRSKSFGRKRSKTLEGAAVEPLPKSSTTASPTPAPAPAPAPEEDVATVATQGPSTETPETDCAQRKIEVEPETLTTRLPESPRSPDHTSFASVARALNSHPPSPREPTHLASPEEITSSMEPQPEQSLRTPTIDGPMERTPSSIEPQSKPKNLRKRYYSMHRLHDEAPPPDRVDGRPDCASPEPSRALSTPPSHPQPTRTQSASPLTPVAVGSQCSVEERFPGWQGKPAAQSVPTDPLVLPNAQRLRLMRSQTYAEGIPPLPELPADIATKVSRADEMVAKKLRTSPRSSPLTSARSSMDAADTTRKTTVIRNAARKELESRMAKENRIATLDRLNGDHADTSTLEAPSPPQGHIQRWSIDGTIQLPRPEDQAQPSSPTHDSAHPGWPSWEKQSSLWRQRRQAVIGPRTAPVRKGSAPAGGNVSVDSPSIVVSRYITPLAAENVHNANNAMQNQNDSAESLAQSYSELITSDKENFSQTKPEFGRADSIVSTATFVTVSSTDGRPTKLEIPRTGSAISSFTTTTMTTVSSTSLPLEKGPTPPQHGRSKSTYSAYKPSDAARAERSRALSLARRSFHASQNSLSAPAEDPAMKQRSSEDLFDRYSGGLNYGWDRNSGFGGSAGMRSSTSFDLPNWKRKSVKMSEEFGLDLSDVPVFLRKV